MIFISGVHGVGKTFFCNKIKTDLGIDCYSSSSLIANQKKQEFSSDKRVDGINENQLFLLQAVKELRDKGKEFLLDGHFCLLNGEGKITRIPVDTFFALAPNSIVLLTENPDIISKRRQERDNIACSAETIKVFQEEEIKYANEISETLKIPIMIASGSKDIDLIEKFISSRRG